MIYGFKDQYRFLSNFYLSPMTINGIIFQTVEHYYQAMKSTSYDDYLLISKTNSPGHAKKLGKKIDIRSDWDNIKHSIMKYAVYEKFKIPEFQIKLIKTEDKQLIEANYWGDEYWGVNIKTGVGENNLGKLLMDVRLYYINLREYNSTTHHNINFNYNYT